MTTNIVSKEDLNYLAQQSSENLNMILAGMTALMNDTDNKIAMMENQTWFQRMCRTISGKNKMTGQEIQRNHDKINMYMSQAITELFEQNCIDRQIMMSLGNQLNGLYAENLQLKQMLGAFVSKLNEKIESIDNYNMLNEEIKQGVYSNCPPIVAICKIISQMDKRCMQDSRKMNILQRTMSNHNILNDVQTSLTDYLMSIVDISMDEVGMIYIELSSLRGNVIANIIIRMIENYHFLPDMTRKIKNKQSLVESILINEQLNPYSTLSINDIYSNLVNNKLSMIEELIQIPDTQYGSNTQHGSNLEEAENLFLHNKLDEAYEIFKTLAEQGNGRAMYFLGEYYEWGYGSVNKDKRESQKWRLAGRDAGDVLATLNVAYTLPEYDSERTDIFTNTFDDVLKLAECGDAFAQYEVSILYEYGLGIRKNNDEKLHWLERSAEHGFWKAEFELREYYFEQGKKCDNDFEFEEKIFYYKKAAELGYIEAMNALGNYYMDDIETSDEAIRWFKEAAALGDADAMNTIGYIYYEGLGISKDYCEAFRWFKKAAEKGLATAQNNLAYFYKSGKGCAENIDKAKEWAMKAAKQGDKNAKKNLKKWFKIVI